VSPVIGPAHVDGVLTPIRYHIPLLPISLGSDEASAPQQNAGLFFAAVHEHRHFDATTVAENRRSHARIIASLNVRGDGI